MSRARTVGTWLGLVLSREETERMRRMSRRDRFVVAFADQVSPAGLARLWLPLTVIAAINRGWSGFVSALLAGLLLLSVAFAVRALWRRRVTTA